MTTTGDRPRILFAQFLNPGAYPPLLNVAAIVAGELGAEVRFVGVRTPGTEGLSIPDDLGTEHWLPDLPARGWRQKMLYLRWLAVTVANAISWRADLVYVSDFYAAPAGVLLRPLGVDVVYHEHDYPARSVKESSWTRLLLRARRRMGRIALACVAPGDARARALERDIGSGGRTYSVPNHPRRQELLPELGPVGGAAPSLHYHGSVGEERLPLSVLDALALLPEDVVLQVVGYETIGSLGYFDRIRRRAVELGIADRVTIRNSGLTRRELFDTCRRATLGLMLVPPDSDDLSMQTMAGASNKIFDYLACGLPIVVSDAPGLGDLIRGAAVGAVCEDLSAAGIAAAVSSLLDDRMDADDMRRRGRRLIEEEWNYDVQFRPVLEVLRRRLAPCAG